jgi:precorrin-2 dehydrogenase/sirohydrochlorin ferrochelatase
MVYYPINLNIAGRKCLVVGGGPVAARKVLSLLECGARVRVVSPVVNKLIADAAAEGRIEWLQRRYSGSDLEGMFLVFAATSNSDTQDRIGADSRRAGVLLNCVDDPEKCDFQVPAKIRRGKLLIAISTGGGSPALAARIKGHLQKEYGPEYGLLVDLMAAVREQLVGNVSPERNRRLFHEILSLPLLDLLKDEKWHAIQNRLSEILPESVNCQGLVAQLHCGDK